MISSSPGQRACQCFSINLCLLSVNYSHCNLFFNNHRNMNAKTLQEWPMDSPKKENSYIIPIRHLPIIMPSRDKAISHWPMVKKILFRNHCKVTGNTTLVLFLFPLGLPWKFAFWIFKCMNLWKKEVKMENGSFPAFKLLSLDLIHFIFHCNANMQKIQSLSLGVLTQNIIGIAAQNYSLICLINLIKIRVIIYM